MGWKQEKGTKIVSSFSPCVFLIRNMIYKEKSPYLDPCVRVCVCKRLWQLRFGSPFFLTITFSNFSIVDLISFKVSNLAPPPFQHALCFRGTSDCMTNFLFIYENRNSRSWTRVHILGLRGFIVLFYWPTSSILLHCKWEKSISACHSTLLLSRAIHYGERVILGLFLIADQRWIM